MGIIDKRQQYRELEQKIIVLLQAVEIEAQLLRNEVAPQLERECKTEHWETPIEVLRDYAVITRNIRDKMFSCLDTHILTIERLSDKICARRAALERTKRLQAKRDAKIAESPLAKLLAASKSMSEEEKQKLKELFSMTPATAPIGEDELDH